MFAAPLFPIKIVVHAAKVAKANHVPFILNPALARILSDELLAMVDIIKPNETEARTIIGVQLIDHAGADVAADVLLNKGVKAVIVAGWRN